MALNRSHNPGRDAIQREFSLRSAAFQTAPILCPALPRLLVQEAAELESNGVSVVNVPINRAAIGVAPRVAQAKAHRSTRAARTISSQAGLATALAVALISTMILAPGVAPAQSPNGTIKEFGLIGTWADDCNKRPAPSNQHATFTVNSRGAVLLRNDFGPDYGDMIYRILEATRQPISPVVAPGADHRQRGGARYRDAEDQCAGSHLVLARGRRTTVCRGWARSVRQQPRNRVDGAVRYEIGEQDAAVNLGTRRTARIRFENAPAPELQRNGRAAAFRSTHVPSTLAGECPSEPKRGVAATGALW
jgi:hypothetical protein